MKNKVFFKVILCMALVFGLALVGCSSSPPSQPAQNEVRHLDDDFPELDDGFSEEDNNIYTFLRWGMSQQEVLAALQEGDVVSDFVINQVIDIQSPTMWMGVMLGRGAYTGQARYFDNRLSHLTLTSVESSMEKAGFFTLDQYDLFKQQAKIMENYIIESTKAHSMLVDDDSWDLSDDEEYWVTNNFPSYETLAGAKARRIRVGSIENGVTTIACEITLRDFGGESVFRIVFEAKHTGLEAARSNASVRNSLGNS
jgi:hypothetical protein